MDAPQRPPAHQQPDVSEPLALPAVRPLRATRLMRPWWLVIAGASVLLVGERIAGAWAGHSGERFDHVLDLSLITFLSITMVWAPMWTMRIIRTRWRGLDREARLACAWQVWLQSVLVTPALWWAVTTLTRDVGGGRLLAVSAVGSAVIGVGGAISLRLRS